MTIPPTSPLYGNFRVAFEYADPLDPAASISMYVASPESGVEPLTQSGLTTLTSQIDCATGNCIVSPDLGYFFYNQGGTLRVGEINDTPSVNIGALSEIAQDVVQVHVAGTRLG